MPDMPRAVAVIPKQGSTSALSLGLDDGLRVRYVLRTPYKQHCSLHSIYRGVYCIVHAPYQTHIFFGTEKPLPTVTKNFAPNPGSLGHLATSAIMDMDNMLAGGMGGGVGQFPLEQWFYEMPVCTRWWTTATVATSILVQCQIITPFQLFYSFRAVFVKNQVRVSPMPQSTIIQLL